MRETSSPAIDLPDDPVEEAMSDHHLDEVTEMIERARTRKPRPGLH